MTPSPLTRTALAREDIASKSEASGTVHTIAMKSTTTGAHGADVMVHPKPSEKNAIAGKGDAGPLRKKAMVGEREVDDMFLTQNVIAGGDKFRNAARPKLLRKLAIAVEANTSDSIHPNRCGTPAEECHSRWRQTW